MPLANQNLPLMFLSARNPQELRIQMRNNNTRFARRFHYSIPMFAQNKWWTWFEVAEKDRQEVNDASK